MPETNARIKVCHDTAANFKTNNPTLLVGEWALETDTKKMKIGDGSTAYNALPYSTAEDSEEWQKPTDWMDIRSGALPNSVYFLVGHSTDYTEYPEFAVYAETSLGTSYDVYIDGIKFATTSSSSITSINWQTLSLSSGWNVSYPQMLKTHIVRVTPTNPAAELQFIRCADVTNHRLGVLWAHFNINYRTNIGDFVSTWEWSGVETYKSPLFEALTSNNGLLRLYGIGAAFDGTAIVETPIFEFINPINWAGIFFKCNKIKKVRFKNMKVTDNGYSADAFYQSSIKEIELLGDSVFGVSPYTFYNCHNLKALPPFKIIDTSINWANMLSLKDTNIDLASYDSMKRINISNNEFSNGIKGLTVSSSAPFDSTDLPQINVSYTGLDRAALVNLFKSLPYNIGYMVIGSPTITDGELSNTGSGNYAMLPPINLFSNDSFEYVASFHIGNTLPSEGYIVNMPFKGTDSTTKAYGTYVSGSSFCIYGGIDSSNNMLEHYLTLTVNTDYAIKWKKQNGVITTSLKVGNNDWQQILTDDGANKTSNPDMHNIVLGGANMQDGYIDLNNTYIKVNGVPFFGPGVTKNLVPGGTVVGSPTITNGVASGFSHSKYIRAPKLPGPVDSYFTARYPFTFVTRFKTPSSVVTTDQYIAFGDISIVLKHDTNNVNVVYNNGTDAIYCNGETALSTDTFYFVKVVFDGTTVTMYLSTDGSAYTEEASTEEIVTNISENTFIGAVDMTSYGLFTGSIDLNNTYLIANNEVLYRGMVPQEKICSVVGCTGTADLTADDKAIAIGKGWELTVA